MDATNPTVLQTPHLFTPNVLLPAQFARPQATSWLRRLYSAILEDALACLVGKGPVSQPGRAGDGARRRREAWAWIMSEAETCFSFLTICWLLDLNVEAVRAEACRRVERDPEAFPEVILGLQ